MAEHRSALAAVYRPGRVGAPGTPAPVTVRERVGRTLVQVSAWPATYDMLSRRLEALLGCRLPGDCRRAVTQGARSIFRVAPERLWLAGPADDALLRTLGTLALDGDAVVTEIGHSRIALRVGGAAAGQLLNRGLPVDLDGAVFPDDAFAQSLIHHVPVLVHRQGVDGGVFDVYVTCDYAESFWEWLTGAARSFGCEIQATG